MTLLWINSTADAVADGSPLASVEEWHRELLATARELGKCLEEIGALQRTGQLSSHLTDLNDQAEALIERELTRVYERAHQRARTGGDRS